MLTESPISIDLNEVIVEGYPNENLVPHFLNLRATKNEYSFVNIFRKVILEIFFNI